MRNEDIIRLAVQITEENNSVYKKAARNQAFMIKAQDSSGYESISRERNRWRNRKIQE